MVWLSDFLKFLLMQKSDLNYLHRQTLDYLKAIILNGTLVPGEKFYSRAELCRKFGLSSSMAHRIHAELQAANMILPQCGSKFIVNAVSVPEFTPSYKLKKVFSVGDGNCFREGSFAKLVMDGVQEACMSFGLEFEMEFVSVLNKSANYINTKRSVAPDTGVILYLGMDLHREAMPLLLNSEIPLVTVNSLFSHRSAVLPDYRMATRQLLEEAVSRGAKKVMYCSGFELQHCPIIAGEREAAFAEYSMFLGLEYMIANSGNFHQLCRKAAKFKPDVMLFLNDVWATHFVKHYLGKCDFVPRIFGCDNHLESFEECRLTTWDTDPAAQGRAAVEVLLNPMSTIKPYITRTKGKLIVRD